MLSVVLGMFLMASSLDLVLVGSFPTFLGFTIISATAVIITVACYLWAAEKQACG